MMQVYQYKPPYNTDTVEPFHLIESKSWQKSEVVPGTQQFVAESYCGNSVVIISKFGAHYKYEPLSKDKHSKNLCEQCVKFFKRAKNARASQ